MILDTRTILRPPTPHLHNTVLLNIMTLTGDNSTDNLARTQPNTGHLALARIRLLGLGDTRLDADALQRRVVLQCWGAAAARALATAAPAADLVVGCADDGGAGELAEGGGLGTEDGREGEVGGEWVCGCGCAAEGAGCKGAEGC